jgi:DNA-binding transcriptional MerR regulator
VYHRRRANDTWLLITGISRSIFAPTRRTEQICTDDVDSDYCYDYSIGMTHPHRHRDARFDLEGLCAAAAEMLGSEGPEDQRVRAVPDARTVRYYQTIGLVDRPEREGREAIYTWRHLLQVVAVKRLQVRGEPLSRIQAALFGVTTASLEAALQLADAPEPSPPTAPAVAEEASFVSREIAPGVLVVVDRRRVVDPESLFQALSRAMCGGS